MLITQKTQYALRAVFELAKRKQETPMTVGEIAEHQAIPPRFLEVILGQLRQAGVVVSQRGPKGGYLLSRDPATLTVGDVIRTMEGSIGPVHCVSSTSRSECPLWGNCAFYETWEEAREAISAVFDRTTFADLLERERRARTDYVPSYSI